MGKISRTFEFVVIETETKTGTAVTEGQVVVFDTDGVAPASAGASGKFGVALETVSPGAGEQEEILVALKGAVRVPKESGALNFMQFVVAGASGAVKARTSETMEKVVGYVIDPDGAAADETEVEIMLV